MEVDDDLAPLHTGTTATIRATSLSGIANRYVSLTPGPNSSRRDRRRRAASAPTRPARRSTSTCSSTRSTPKTRKGLQNVDPRLGHLVRGRAARRPTRALKYFAAVPQQHHAADQRARARRGDASSASCSDTRGDRVGDRRAPRRPGRAGRATPTPRSRAIGDENASLDRALELLPSTLRKANTTFVNLRSTLDDLDQLVDESKPATKDLARFLRELRPLVREARPDGRRPARADPHARRRQRPDRADRRSSRGWRS